MGNAKSFIGSVFRIKWSLQKLIHGPVHPFHTPCCELVITRMKRGGVEVIVASCIF